MSFEQLRAFVTVAEEANLTRAAARLHVCQPPLTRRIRGLEDEVGAALFERRASGMRLLPAGERLLVHARAILAAVDAARADLRAAGVTERSGASTRDRARARGGRSGTRSEAPASTPTSSHVTTPASSGGSPRASIRASACTRSSASG